MSIGDAFLNAFAIDSFISIDLCVPSAPSCRSPIALIYFGAKQSPTRVSIAFPLISFVVLLFFYSFLSLSLSLSQSSLFLDLSLLGRSLRTLSLSLLLVEEEVVVDYLAQKTGPGVISIH